MMQEMISTKLLEGPWFKLEHLISAWTGWKSKDGRNVLVKLTLDNTCKGESEITGWFNCHCDEAWSDNEPELVIMTMVWTKTSYSLHWVEGRDGHSILVELVLNNEWARELENTGRCSCYSDETWNDNKPKLVIMTMVWIKISCHDLNRQKKKKDGSYLFKVNISVKTRLLLPHYAGTL